MKRYHVFKASRLYEGVPYCGAASNYESAQFDTQEQAIKTASELSKNNPVGFVVYDSHTLERIEK